MRKHGPWLIAGALSVRFVVAQPSPAAAYTYLYTCNGCPSSIQQTINLKRHAPSLPTGAAATNDLVNASIEWSSAPEVRATFWTPVVLNGTMNGNTVPSGDGQWETALVTRASIGGNNGKTIYLAGACVFGCNYIDEADLLVASDMAFGNPDESGWDIYVNGVESGRDTFMHEWGHVMGLGHAPGFSCVRTAQPDPRVGGTGTHVTTFGDDRNGVGHPYGFPSSYTNLAASAQKLVGGDIVSATFIGTLIVAPGTTVPMDFTSVNTSTQSKTFGQMIFLRPHWATYSGGIIAKTFEGSQVGARNQTTFLSSFTTPSALPCGQLHWVYHHVDTGNAHAEAREFDNATHHTVTVLRNCP